MSRIRLEPSVTRAELRDAHELIVAGDGAPLTLTLGDDLQARTPGQFSAWMQLVLAWGQDVSGRTLEITPAAQQRIISGDPLSDLEVFAVLLAETVLVTGVDITAEVQPPIREVLSKRRVLTSHHGDGVAATRSILLASHVFTNLTSPDLHASWEGELAIEESARTLYHDVWPVSSAPDVLRSPMVDFGEVVLPAGNPTHIARTTTIEGQDPKPISTLGARAPRARGLAHALATTVRQQPKPLHDEVGEMLFELVQNTQWHASKWPGGRTGANCRAIAFREYSYTKAELDAANAFDPNFVAYVKAAADRAQAQTGSRIGRVVMGSVTVIDSGVGLAKSVALSLDEDGPPSADTEIQYLIAALSKNLKRRRADLGNIGLARVQQSLTNLNGFMSLRTGTVELLRDFVRTPFEPIPNRPKKGTSALIVDWIPPREEDFVVGPRLGTAVTIVYPVDYEVAR